MTASERKATWTAAAALALIFLFCTGVCLVGLSSGEISIGRPLRVTARLDESPLQFWFTWCLWAGVGLFCAYGVFWLLRHLRQHKGP